jgi:sugar lactone lactonase YvrE
MSNPQFINSGLNGPQGIAFDNAGNLYVTNSNIGTIEKYSSDGVKIGTNPFISGIYYPLRIAFDSSGNLYVISYGNNSIDKYSSTGVKLNEPYISGLNLPWDIDFDSAGNLYVLNQGNNRIEKYSSSGVPLNTPLISELNSPSSMAFDNAGNLYVTNFSNNTIGKYSSGGSLITTSFISGILRPTVIAFDSAGYLYVANFNTIGKYSSDGVSLNTRCISGLSSPISMAFDSAGYLYVANFGNNTIGKYVITPVIPDTPISNICFPAGTHISTNQGQIPIEKINTEIHTIRNKKIVGITQTITQDKYLVCFEKDSLEINLPSQKTIISKNHGIFYKGKMMQAKEFIGKFENVKKIKYTGEILYNVLMEEDNKMMVNNLICETLHPENGIAKLYKILQNANPKEQQKIIEEYNEYAIKNKVFSSKK